MLFYGCRSASAWSAGADHVTVGRPGVFRALRSHVGTAHNAPAWMCLALISRFSPVEQPLFALDYFTEQIQTELVVRHGTVAGAGLRDVDQVGELQVVFSCCVALAM